MAEEKDHTPEAEAMIDLNTIYPNCLKKDIIKKNLVPFFDLGNGDILLALASRGNHTRFQNKYHGWVPVRVKLHFNGWEMYAEIFKEDVQFWEKKIGREHYDQRVGAFFVQPCGVLGRLSSFPDLDFSKRKLEWRKKGIA